MDRAKKSLAIFSFAVILPIAIAIGIGNETSTTNGVTPSISIGDDHDSGPLQNGSVQKHISTFTQPITLTSSATVMGDLGTGGQFSAPNQPFVLSAVNSAQAITAGNTQSITFGNNMMAQGITHTPGTAGFTIPSTGFYWVHCMLTFDHIGNSTNTIEAIQFYDTTASALLISETGPGSDTVNTTLNFTAIFPGNAGDTFNCMGFQNSANSINILGDNNVLYSSFNMIKLF